MICPGCTVIPYDGCGLSYFPLGSALVFFFLDFCVRFFYLNPGLLALVVTRTRVCNDDTIEESDFHDNEFKKRFDEAEFRLTRDFVNVSGSKFIVIFRYVQNLDNRGHITSMYLEGQIEC